MRRKGTKEARERRATRRRRRCGAERRREEKRREKVLKELKLVEGQQEGSSGRASLNPTFISFPSSSLPFRALFAHPRCLPGLAPHLRRPTRAVGPPSRRNSTISLPFSTTGPTSSSPVWMESPSPSLAPSSEPTVQPLKPSYLLLRLCPSTLHPQQRRDLARQKATTNQSFSPSI